MGRLIVCETDRGHYAVRPEHWAGMYKDGKIQEGGLNHTAVFMNKEDAELFVKCKEQPIAYDVEAVVKELEDYRRNYSSGLGGFTDELCDRIFRNVIDIVRKGGANHG